ncbi:MAG: coiled-coil domain-containing protein [Methylobacter sp.]
MTPITFDTHEFIKELKNAGFSEQQAEAITNLQKTAIGTTLEQVKHDYQLDDLATKRDLKELELKVDAGIRELELKVAKDIAESKAELIRWVVGVGVLQMTLIAGLMLKLTHSI